MLAISVVELWSKSKIRWDLHLANAGGWRWLQSASAELFSASLGVGANFTCKFAKSAEIPANSLLFRY